jgi:hypothetical protein
MPNVITSTPANAPIPIGPYSHIAELRLRKLTKNAFPVLARPCTVLQLPSTPFDVTWAPSRHSLIDGSRAAFTRRVLTP